MLPLLPALILLLLNGPANLERMAERGALPAALAAIQQKATTNAQKAATSREQMALASLLSLSGDPQVSKALAHIFAIQVACETIPCAKPEELQQSDSGEPPPIVRSIGKPQRGFLHSQRSRDGPVSC